MKRVMILFALLVMVFTVTFVYAWTLPNSIERSPRKNEPPPNGEERLGILYLFQKTAAQGPWPVVHGGAWGVLRYNLWGEYFNYLFHGRKLMPHTDYTLIYYPDPWPGEGLVCLGSGKANPAGNLTIKDSSFDIGTSLPAAYDANWAPMYPSGAVGAKIWLVLSRDVDCGSVQPGPQMNGLITSQMIGWDPDNYLFEYNLINFELLNN